MLAEVMSVALEKVQVSALAERVVFVTEPDARSVASALESMVRFHHVSHSGRYSQL